MKQRLLVEVSTSFPLKSIYKFISLVLETDFGFEKFKKLMSNGSHFE